MEKKARNPMGIRFGDGKQALPNATPLRILVLGRFGGGQSDHAKIDINTDNFNEIFNQLKPSISLTLPQITGNQDPIDIQLDHFKYFHPKHLVKNLQLIRPLWELIQSIEAFTQHRGNDSDLQALCERYANHGILRAITQYCLRTLQCPINTSIPQVVKDKPVDQPTPSTPGKKDSPGLDSLFDMVDSTGSNTQDSQPAPKQAVLSGVDKIVRDVVGSDSLSINHQMLDCLKAAKALLHQQLDSLLHHPAWQSLESSWRGLKLVLDRTDFREPIKIEIIDVSKENLRDVFTPQFIEEEYNNTENPLTAIILDSHFQRSDADFELLQTMAEAGQELQVPVVTGLHYQFFADTDISKASQPSQALQKPGYEKWQALRQKDCSRWLNMGFNRCLLREAYSAEQNKQLDYNENLQDASDLIWGNSAWVIAALICQSHAHTGWPTEITGQQNKLTQLPLTPQISSSKTPAHYPLEFQIMLPVAEDLSQVGVTTLVAQANRDVVFLVLAQCVHKAHHFGDKQTTLSSRFLTSLAYQLLLSRVIKTITAFKYHLPTNIDHDQLSRHWQKYLTEYLASSGKGSAAQVEIIPNPDNDNEFLLHLQLQTGRAVMNSVPIEMRLPI